MKLIIEKVENGYIVTSYDEYEDGTPKEVKEVIADKDMDFNDDDCLNKQGSKTMMELLWLVKEYFLSQSRKHDKYFVEIKVIERENEE